MDNNILELMSFTSKAGRLRETTPPIFAEQTFTGSGCASREEQTFTPH
jgi:hypothetical protein